MHECRAENGLCVGGNAEGVPGAGCGQGQPCLPQPPPQAFFFSWSPCALQHVLPSFFTSFLQQSAPLPQAKTAAVGIAEKAKANRNGSDMAVKTRNICL
jgi:hypothetical protein